MAGCLKIFEQEIFTQVNLKQIIFSITATGGIGGCYHTEQFRGKYFYRVRKIFFCCVVVCTSVSRYHLWVPMLSVCLAELCQRQSSSIINSLQHTNCSFLTYTRARHHILYFQQCKSQKYHQCNQNITYLEYHFFHRIQNIMA